MLEPEAIPAGLENKIEIIPEAGSITLKGSFTTRQVEALENAFQTPAGKETVRQAIAKLKTPKGRNSKDWDLPGNEEKRSLGELWERRSNGKGLFIMPRGKDWAAIREKAQKAQT
jgi:hypothetical protein